MIELIEYLSTLAEIEREKKDLRVLGLTEEEIEGYIDMYLENFFPASGKKGVKN